LAAVYCLIQNLKLLGLEQGIGVKVAWEDWMYDRDLCRSLGIRDGERIAAIADLGYAVFPGTVEKEPFPQLRISEC